MLALELEGWRLGPEEFQYLAQRQLSMAAGPLAERFRQLGCVCTSTRLGAEDGEAQGSYVVTLLRGGDKSLADSFPKPKMARAQGQ